LESAGFSVAFDSVEADLPRGSVIEIRPAPGTEAPIPSEVRLVVSAGPAQVAMPNVVGLDEAPARDTLAALGLAVTLMDEVSPEAPETPRVVGQDPVAEAVLLRGTEVRINISRRTPRPDTIPPQEPRR
jgi:serine/threonine-protein kinase